MLFQKRFILVLFHERFKLPSSHHWNFWLTIKLSFQNSDLWAKFLPPLEISNGHVVSMNIKYYFSGATNFGTLCIHCCLGTHVPQIATWHDSHLSGCEGDYMPILLFLFLILSLIFSFLHISSPHPKDNYSVGCIFLILQFALSGPLHSRIFTICKNNTRTGLLSLSSSVTL